MNAGNFAIKEEIREYWSKRADTFDQSPGHGMNAPGERDAWRDKIARHIHKPSASRVLELAFGTGEVTRVLSSLNYEVTGLDLSERMLALAKAKHAGIPKLKFYLGDAEDTREADQSYDAVITRHLVWTLINPEIAFRDWHRVLKPGGRLVIIDGNFAHDTLSKKVLSRLAQLLARLEGNPGPKIDRAAYDVIKPHLYFRDGLKRNRLQAMLADAGFSDFNVEDLSAVVRIQCRNIHLSDRIKLRLGQSFILSCMRGH